MAGHTRVPPRPRQRGGRRGHRHHFRGRGQFHPLQGPSRHVFPQRVWYGEHEQLGPGEGPTTHNRQVYKTNLYVCRMQK